MTDALVILGASGDLTRRYLLPGLARLHAAGRLPDGWPVRGVGQQDWTDQRFRAVADEAVRRHAPDVPAAARSRLLADLSWLRADVTDPGPLRPALDTGDRRAPVVVYLALPPMVFGPALEALRTIGLPAGSRIVVEKPFGVDGPDAVRLNALVQQVVPESAVFRVDHFLGKQTVQNLLGLRFANRVFEPVWNAGHVQRVDVVWDETIGLEGRAGYYDRAGALRDMVQNHLLQLLCLVAMEPPASLNERDLRDRKVDVLRAVRTLTPDQVASRSVRARYYTSGAGLPSYVDEPGVDPARGTETFAELTLHVDNWRWAGVPFVLRSGKGLGADRREISIAFRPVPHLAFGQAREPTCNLLQLTLEPDRISFAINLNGRGDPFALEEASLDAALAPQDLPAYGRLLLDVLAGEPTLSIRADEAEESWRIIEPVLDTWQQGSPPLEEYQAGSDGPTGRRDGGGTR